MAVYFDLQNRDSSFGLLSKFDVRPAYYVHPMYGKLGSTLLSTQSHASAVTVTAALRDDGALTLLIVNRGPDSQTVGLSLGGYTPSAEAEVWRFDASHNAEQIATEPIKDGSALTLPGQSITSYVVKGKPAI